MDNVAYDKQLESDVSDIINDSFNIYITELPEELHQHYTNVNDYKALIVPVTKSDGTVYYTYSEDLYNDFFKEYIQNFKVAIPRDPIITDKVDLDTPCFYVSLSYNDVNDTYRNNLKNNSYMRFFDGSLCNMCEIGNGEFTAINLHTLFDEKLYACEQGGSNIKKVTDLKKVTFTNPITNSDIADTHLSNFCMTLSRNPANDGYSEPISNPALPLPGTGTPWFTYATSNHAVYPDIEFYFTKSNYNGTITLVFFNRHDESVEPVIQSLVFGRVDGDMQSYLPLNDMGLYICGATCALGVTLNSMNWKTSAESEVIHTKTVRGMAYNLDIRNNVSNSGCNILYPSKVGRTI